DLTDTGQQGVAYASGAFFDRWRGQLPLDVEVVTVKLRSPTLAKSFTASAVALVDNADIEFGSDRVAKDATRVQAFGLAALSAIVAIAGVVVLGQALSRASSFGPADRAIEEAVGMTRGGRTAAEVLPAIAVIVAGTLLGIIGAVIASPLFPQGLAGRAEFRPGVRLDPPILALGGLFAVLALLAWVMMTTRVSVARDAARRQDPRSLARSRWLSRVAALGPVASIGIRFALKRSKGRQATPTVSSLAGAVAGVVGVVGVVVFGASLGHLLATPALAGANWDAETGNAPAAFITDAGSDIKDTPIDGIATIRTAQIVAGGTTVEGYG